MKALRIYHTIMARLCRSRTFRFVTALMDVLKQDYLGLISAGVAFYFLLAAFPALGALISIYGIFSDPKFVADQLQLLGNFLPPEALKILADQAYSIVEAHEGALGFGFIVSVFLAVYSATKGVNALISGFNIAYNLSENRNFVTLNMTAFTLTFVMLIYFLISLGLIAVLPALVHILPLPEHITKILLLLRWPLLFVAAIGGLEILYYYGPAHKERVWHWCSKGSLIATILWLIMSSLFSLFVYNFGNYNETYGSLSAVIILLLWFWLSAMTVLFGAEVNTVLKQKTPVPDKTGCPLIP